jgi:putative ABC transport system substrate-binding protein
MGQIQRRQLLIAAGAMLVAPRALAQAGRTHWVAFLSGGRPSDSEQFLNAFLGGMREHGYRVGANLSIDAQYAEYSTERAAKLAAEIAGRKPAVILAQGGGIAPACRLSPPLPVVFLHSGDPVEAGYVDSLARPGRNATGISLLALDLILKRMEFLKDVKPGLRRVAFLASPEHAGHKRELAASRTAAAQLGVQVSYYEVSTPADIAAALPKVAAEKPDAALLFSDSLMIGQRQLLAEFFLRQRIPSAAGWSAFPDSGHLLSYGAERSAVWRRLAYFADRILKGARPADLPVELPTIFELVVNRKTAAEMGLAVPPSILARADRAVD